MGYEWYHTRLKREVTGENHFNMTHQEKKNHFLYLIKEREKKTQRKCPKLVCLLTRSAYEIFTERITRKGCKHVDRWLEIMEDKTKDGENKIETLHFQTKDFFFGLFTNG